MALQANLLLLTLITAYTLAQLLLKVAKLKNFGTCFLSTLGTGLE